MWKPAWSVRLYLPRLSTTYAFCCGTTIAVLAITKTTSATTIRTPIRVVPTRTPPLQSSLDFEHDSAHARDAHRCARRERLGADVACLPGRAAQLHGALRAGRDLRHCNARLADQLGCEAGRPADPPLVQSASEQRVERHRDHRELEPLDPCARRLDQREQETHRHRRATDRGEPEIGRHH